MLYKHRQFNPTGLCYEREGLVRVGMFLSTVLPAKSDSNVMLCYKVGRDLESIDHLCINPIRRIGLIHK